MTDRERIERLINQAREQFPAGKGDGYVLTWRQGEEIARSCLSDRAKLEERVNMLTEAGEALAYGLRNNGYSETAQLLEDIIKRSAACS